MSAREELIAIVNEHPEICKDLLAALEEILAAEKQA